MIAIPAIDLIDGRCVRLTEGVFDTAKVYGDDPAAVARGFAEAGVRRLHLVDLDAARGEGNNREVIAEVRKAFPGILDVGGGVRSLEDAKSLGDLGVDLMVVGTALAKDPDEVARWAAILPGSLVAGIDAREGEVKISGWESGSSLRAVGLAAKAREIGMAEIIYTDIARDGTLTGPNVPETVAVAEASGLPVVISGGVSGMDDLRSLADDPPVGVSGVIFGKALYEGHIDLSEAVRLLGGQR
jgi:phosphoribosylformimino-5-aminoimidazole carboxamide ribotide isomerase